MSRKLLLIDNFDSFTHLLADYFLRQKIHCIIERNDVDFEKIVKHEFSGIVLSPGPGVPSNAGILLKVIDYYHKKLPILGICLGHQAIGEYFGSEIANARVPMHGKSSEVFCKPDKIFTGMPDRFKVIRYHSMILKTIPESIETLGFTSENEVMIIKHKVLPIYGIQYHPEAILTEYGSEILKNWISMIKIPN